MLAPSNLIEKYNTAGPRYTSYPPVPFWTKPPTEGEWLSHIKTQYDKTQGLDLYVHIPYCESLCYYCGCSRIVTKDHSVEEALVKNLIKEWELYQSKLGFTPKINSLHFGGGTPTFLSAGHLAELIDQLTFSRSGNFVASIEIDPRTCKKEHLEILAQKGIRRVSLGIQDFSPEVQKTIHRDQSVKMVEEIVTELRKLAFESINFDLIYGLPKQTIESVTQTIDSVKILRPDLIAFYSYAHLPERIKNQKLIKNEDLPDANLKRRLYETGKKLLIDAGYVDIGMDHFALPGSFLYQAKMNKKLHRNFMGYVDKKSNIMIGLGPTSISDSSVSFAQNFKELKYYYSALDNNQLPIEKGHIHSKEDLIVQKIILDLMCHNEINLSVMHEVPYSELIQKELEDYCKDGLLLENKHRALLSPLGQAFMRNIAMSFDFHLREQKTGTKFSQTI